MTKTNQTKHFPYTMSGVTGSLLPTLKTAVEWLKRGRFLLWNIADTKDGGAYVPLEYDSKAILEDLGMQYETKLETCAVPFARREPIGRRGCPRETKNFCMINGRYRKYEPIFFGFRKPH